MSLVPAYFLMATIGGRFIRTSTSRVSDHVAAASAIASQSLSNVALAHAFSARKRLEMKFTSNLAEAQKEGLKKIIAVAIQFGLLFFIIYSANALAFWQGSKTIASSVDGDRSGITTGSVYTVIFLLVDGMILHDLRNAYLK